MKKIWIILLTVICSMIPISPVSATEKQEESQSTYEKFYANQTIALRMLGQKEHNDPIMIANPVKQLYEGMEFRYILAVTGYEPEWYRWKTSDKEIAEIKERTGELVAKKAGIVTVTVTSKRKKETASYSLEVISGKQKEPMEQKKANEDTLFLKAGTKEVMASDFNDWENLKYVVIPESVEALYQRNYEEASDGTRTPLKDATTGGAFRYDNNVEAYYVDGNNRNFFSIEGVLYRGDLQKELLDESGDIMQDKTIYRYPVAKKDTVFYVPYFVSRVEEYAFAGARNLEKVLSRHYDDNPVKIGAYAFYGCKNLELLQLGSISYLTTKEDVYESIGNFDKANYQENGMTTFEKIQKTKLPFFSNGMKKTLYLYDRLGNGEAGRLLQKMYGIPYRTTEESTTGKMKLEMEYPSSEGKEIGIGNSLYGSPYRLVVQGFHSNATYSYIVKDPSILSVKTKGAYGYLTGKKVGTTTVTCKQKYKEKITTIGTIKITVSELINKEALQQKKAWGLGTYQMRLISYPTTGATYTFNVDKKGLTIEENRNVTMDEHTGASQTVTATKTGNYQVSIQEKYKGKIRNIGTYRIKVAENPNNFKVKKEVNYALGQRIEGWNDLIEGYGLAEEDFTPEQQIITPVNLLLKYDESYFLTYENWKDHLLPIKEGDTVIEIYEYIPASSSVKEHKVKLGEVLVHIKRRELTTLKAKQEEIPMYVGQTLKWKDIAWMLEVEPGWIGGLDEYSYALFNMKDKNGLLSFERNGNAGMDVTALKTGTTTLTITANSKKVNLKVIVFETKEKCYEYIDSKN